MRTRVVVAVVALAACKREPEPAPPVSAPEPSPPVVEAAPPPTIDPGVELRRRMVERAAALELPTTSLPVPGDLMSLHAAGYAKVLCSAVFLTGLELDFAIEHVGWFTAPRDKRALLGKPVIDAGRRRVSVALPDGTIRTAIDTGGQGCVTLPVGADGVSFTPVPLEPKPVAADTPWPLGDVVPPPTAELDPAKLDEIATAAFGPPEAQTAAFVVTWKGQLVVERYADGITSTTPLEGWSLGKNVTATVMGRLIQQGAYTLDQPAPIPEWQQPGDPRAAITIADLMRMSSGLRSKAPQDPEYTPDFTSYDFATLGERDGVYPDQAYYYTGAIDVHAYAASRPPQWPPGTVGRYRNTDAMLVGYLNRLAIERRGEPYLTYPQREVFDKIGVRTMVLETDPFGNFMACGYEVASARDWARLANLYLRDGVAPDGERLLPHDFVEHVHTPAPAWQADERLGPTYGGMFWVMNSKVFPDAYAMLGSGGQIVAIVPSYDLVIVRLGHFSGVEASKPAVALAMKLLKEALPPRAP